MHDKKKELPIVFIKTLSSYQIKDDRHYLTQKTHLILDFDK